MLPPEIAAELEREQLVREAMARLPAALPGNDAAAVLGGPAADATWRSAGGSDLATGSIGFIRGRCLDRLQKALQELGL